MKKSQVCAISYKCAQYKKLTQMQELKDRDLEIIYQYQSKYKTLGGFLKATGANLDKAKNSAIKNIKNYLSRCEDCGNTSHEKYVILKNYIRTIEGENKMYQIRCRENGYVITDFNNLGDAIRCLNEYEAEDKKDGIFEENFYEIYNNETQEIIDF